MTATLHRLPFRPAPGPLPEVWTLQRAIDLCVHGYWRDMRRLSNARSHCKLLTEAIGADTLLEAVTYDALLAYANQRKALGLEPATVFANMAVVPVLYKQAKQHGYTGAVPVVPTVTVPKKLKWWLNPDQREEVTQWLRQQGPDLLDYINWSCATGLRIEETLRLARLHFVKLTTPSPTVLVPGTKTSSSLRTVPLNQEAAAIAIRRLGQDTGQNAPLFAMSYMSLWTQWSKLRSELGLPHGSTPKALRRSFAQALAAKGAPLPVVQQLLGHSSSSTTLEYLRLTGGAFNDEEVRKWL